MNLGLTTSFMIAGVLMLSIVSLNTRLAESSADLTLRYVIEERAETIETMLHRDLPRIGNDVHTTISSPIRDARKNLIEFESNIDNSGAVETIEWKYTSNEIEGSSNPDDKLLYREIDGDRSNFRSGVIDFQFTYLDAQKDTLSYSNLEDIGGGNQSNRNDIKYIVVSFSIETEEPLGGAGDEDAHYLETNWKKRFPVYNQGI